MAEAIESPCVSVCQLDPEAQYCRGCHRTLDEIAYWGRMSSAERRQIMDALADRRAKHEQEHQLS